MKTIIALGSNSNQEENIFKAQTLLKQRFEGVKFSDAQWTEQNHQIGKVLIDIDLAQYGEKIVKKIIWL